MNFIKRALLAVIRKKGRTLILFVVFVAIANLVLAGCAIRYASEYASVLARQKLGGKLILRYNMQAAMERAMSEQGQRPRIQPEPITEDMIKQIASHKNILDYNYIVSTAALAEGFKPVETQNDEENGKQSQLPDERGVQNRTVFPEGINFIVPDVLVTGVASSELLDAFNNGQAKLVEGRHLTHEDAGKNVALVEKNLAEKNSLKTGDSIKLKAVGEDTVVAFTIAGIYEASPDAEAAGPRMRNMSFTDPFNRIYVDYKGASYLISNTRDNGFFRMLGIDSAEFFVDDPVNIDKVLNDSRKMNIDWKKYVLDANDFAYRQMMGPIENVASFATVTLYIVAIAGAIILALILMLSIKDRIYEIGVLLSMGEWKAKIIAQYIIEVIMIAAVAFSLSAFTGKYIAQGLGDMLLKREVSLAQQQNISGFRTATGITGGAQYGRLMRQRFQLGPNGEIKPIDDINIRITASEIGNMFGIGLMIIVAGTILPLSNVMRYKPRAILTKIS